MYHAFKSLILRILHPAFHLIVLSYNKEYYMRSIET